MRYVPYYNKYTVTFPFHLKIVFIHFPNNSKRIPNIYSISDCFLCVSKIRYLQKMAFSFKYNQLISMLNF